MGTPEDLRAQAVGGTFCIVPYCHPDFAWTHHREWHEERYAVSTADALDLMREDPEFRFCVEPWIDHVQPFLERCPERADELRERLTSGQMGVKAFTLASPRPATCPDEAFLRNMILGRRRYREFAPEADLSAMACPDVCIGHSQMPQVVRLAGGRMYRGWRSEAAFNALSIPRDFVWRGLDGTELITSRGIYGGLCWDPAIPDDFADHWDEVTARLFGAELRDAMTNSSTPMWFVAQGMDDCRPLCAWPRDKRQPIEAFIEEWNRRESSHMMFATPNEYGRMLAQLDLPVHEGIIDQVDVAYNSGWHGGRGLWRLRQQLDTAAVITERACALARLAGGEAADPARLEELWTEVVRIQSHALQWVFEKDWEWVNTGARYALRELGEATHAAVSSMAGAGRAFGKDRPLVLFNPLPYDRDEWIEVPWVQPRQDAGGHQVIGPDGQTVELQLGEQAGESWTDQVVEAPLIFRARVPAMGCAVYQVGDAPLEQAPAAPEGDVVDNGRLRLALSGRGLQSIEDVETGITWRAPRGSAIGDCRLFEMGPGVLGIGPITAEMSGETGQGRWITTGPIRWRYRWDTGFHGHRVRQDVVVDRDEGHIDLVTRVFCAGANGFFGLCLDLPVSGAMHVDIPFGVEPRDLSNEVYAMDMPFGMHNIERHRENQFWARSWASVSDGERGVAVITLDGDRYWTYEAATGRLRHILFLALHDVDTTWEAWVPKDRMALGWHEFRHRVVFHRGDWKAADLCGQSDRARLPLQVVKPIGPARDGKPLPPLEVSPGSVRLSAFREETQGYVLRVYESAGESTTASIALPRGFADARRTDFNLEPLEATCSLEGDRLSLPLRPWEIATVLLEG